MGYLTTAVAALATNASNLRPAKELPNISVLDVLLPRYVERLVAVSTEKAKHGNSQTDTKKHVKPNRRPIDYVSVRKDKYGRKQIVAHMAKGGSDGPQAKSDPDKKKDAPGGQKGDKKTDGSFTAKEDALLKELKAKHMPYKDIAVEMKRTQKQVKARCQELNINVDESGGHAAKKDEKGSNKGGGKKQKQFSTEDDNKLKQLAANDTPWSDIAREMKCNIDQLKARLKEIDPEAAGRTEDKGGHQNKEAKHEQPHRPSSKTSSVYDEMRLSMQQWIELQEDGIFDMYELQILMHILMADPEQSWLAVASRFFDHTGRRVHPEDVHDKIEQMSHMR